MIEHVDNRNPRLTVAGALNHALHDLMAIDPRVVIIGEDILDPYGGAFKIAKGLSTRFPDRVCTSPISEAAIVGLAVGMAMRGMRPIVEIMFGDFLLLAADQLINHAAKFGWMYQNAVSVPLVVRTPMGGRRGYGPTHSQCLEKHLLGVPGLWVVAPHVLLDPGALLQQSTLECDEPVVFIESKTCYGKSLIEKVDGMRVQSIRDEAAPFPTTYLQHLNGRANSDGVLCCYGGMTPLCLEAVQELRDKEGLFLDLAIFSQLSPPPTTHLHQIANQKPLELWAYVEEANPIGGWTSEMIAQVEQVRFDAGHRTNIKHSRLGASFTPIATSREVEFKTLPQVSDIVSRIVDCF